MNKISIISVECMCCFSPPCRIPSIERVFPKLDEIVSRSRIPRIGNISIIFHPIIKCVHRKNIRVKGSHPIFVDRRPNIHHNFLIFIQFCNMVSALLIHFFAIHEPCQVIRCPFKSVNMKFFMGIVV